MEWVSIFDIYKIGVGPSSSHTLGPWKAALLFLQTIGDRKVDHLAVELYGSLSKTGKGHGTNVAIMLGLSGHLPTVIDTTRINEYIDKIQQEKKIYIHDQAVDFDPDSQFFYMNEFLPYHPNGMKLIAELEGGEVLSETYYSVGGGFVEQEDQTEIVEEHYYPYPINSEADILTHINGTDMTIWQLTLENEKTFLPQPEIREKIIHIWETMLDCMYRGCHTSGRLPGGLDVVRRACTINSKLLGSEQYYSRKEWIDCIRKSEPSFQRINQWISCFALAVNEENAAFGRIVTSPTNGAAGIIPAVLMYYYCFCDYQGIKDLMKFFMTSGEIGALFKKGATISAAAGGCQAEVGVSAAMAAGGLTELQGGTPRQVLMAAEIAMEHHLGLTCDPVRGLVQVPCIERNAIAAMKAISASNLALHSDPDDAKVNLDAIIRTKWETAQDMNVKYRETSEGGLALNIALETVPNC